MAKYFAHPCKIAVEELKILTFETGNIHTRPDETTKVLFVVFGGLDGWICLGMRIILKRKPEKVEPFLVHFKLIVFLFTLFEDGFKQLEEFRVPNSYFFSQTSKLYLYGRRGWIDRELNNLKIGTLPFRPKNEC